MMNTQPKWTLEGRVKLVGNPDSESGQHNLYVADIRLEDRVGSVCHIQSADHCKDGITRGEAERHALLIATAPELLNLAYEMKSFAEAAMADAEEEGDVLGVVTWSERIRRCDSAIARATGE